MKYILIKPPDPYQKHMNNGRLFKISLVIVFLFVFLIPLKSSAQRMWHVDYADSLQKEFLLGFGGEVWVIEPQFMLLYLNSSDSATLVDSNYTLLLPQNADFKHRGIIVHIPQQKALLDSAIVLGMDVVWRDGDSLFAVGYDRHLLSMDSLGIDYDTSATIRQPVDTEGNEPDRLELKYHSYNTANATFESLTDDLADLASSGICTRISIGTTFEGKDIWAVKISDANTTDQDGKSERKVLITGGVHAMEWISVEIPYLFAEYLVNNYPADPEAEHIVNNEEIWIIPMLNPDGHEYVRSHDDVDFWRKNRNPNLHSDSTETNCTGVDLNRNYDVGRDGTSPWPIGNTSYKESSDTYWGPYAESEKETKAIVALMNDQEFDAAIEYHSFTQKVGYGWGTSENSSPNVCVLKEITDEMTRLINEASDLPPGSKYESGQISLIVYDLCGDFNDWAYKEFNIPVVSVELRPKTGDLSGFDLPASQIDNCWLENKPGLIYFVKWVRNLDYGDAEDPGYPSKKASNGARHDDFMWEWLGACTDGETDSRQVNKETRAAHHDDGVSFFGPLEPGEPVDVEVEMRASVLHYRVDGSPVIYDHDDRYTALEQVHLYGWFDWNGDKDWADAGELVIHDAFNPDDPVEWSKIGGDSLTGVQKFKTYSITPPADLKRTVYYSRFRLTYIDDWAASTLGRLEYGEVEDYIHSGPDFGDAPAEEYPTCKEDNGAWHKTAGIYEWLGRVAPGDPSRQVSIEFNADDPYDEDSGPNVGSPECCATGSDYDIHSMDHFDDGYYAPPTSFCECMDGTLDITIGTSGEKSNRYAYEDDPNSLLYCNLFIDWKGDGDWNDHVRCREAGINVKEHIEILSCVPIGSPGYGSGILNSLPDNRLIINPNKWTNGTDTLITRKYRLQFKVPYDESQNYSWARLRLDYGEETNTHLPTGEVDFGEVEDFKYVRTCPVFGIIEEILFVGDMKLHEWLRMALPLPFEPWRYFYWRTGMGEQESDSATGALDFRVAHPEFEGQEVFLQFNQPDQISPTGWHQIYTAYGSPSVDIIATNIVDYPWEFMPLDSLPFLPYYLPLLGPIEPCNGVSDTIFMAVNLNTYVNSNPFWFDNGNWEIGHTLADLGLQIIDGRIDGIEGMYFADSRIEVDPQSSIGFTPIGGPASWFNSQGCEDNIAIFDANANFKLLTMPETMFTVRLEKTHNSLQGHYEMVSITLENSPYQMGGFDFLIAYDASALAFTEAQPGQLLEDCQWEYFTYSFGVHGSCGSACPSGMLRIIALAETSNGPNHPSCFGPPDTDAHELAKLVFYVSNDRTFECQYVPVYFFWDDCGDNSISSVDGETLYIDRTIYGFNGDIIWDEADDEMFPEDARIPFVGAPDYCLNPDPDKPTAVRRIDFINGGIDIICADSIDVRGDINLNGAANEIADAVVFTNYFIYGLAAFTINQEGQIAATDVNADGMVLSVADLAYLIRIIIGDASPYAKISPVTAKYDIKDGILSVDQEMGAAYVVIKGNANPVNMTDKMEMKYAYDSDNDLTKALIYSMEKDHKFIGSFLKLNGTLTEIEMATYEGATVKLITDLLPTEFVLHQNYPNPFNAVTSILFELPTAAHVEIDIFNVAGRKVITLLDKELAAGIHNIKWDGVDQSGNQVGSGVYFYKLKAKDYEETRKMMLLK